MGKLIVYRITPPSNIICLSTKDKPNFFYGNITHCLSLESNKKFNYFHQKIIIIILKAHTQNFSKIDLNFFFFTF